MSLDISTITKPELLAHCRRLEAEVSQLRSQEQTARVERNEAVRVLRELVDREALRTAICLGCGRSDGPGERCGVEAVLGGAE